jgi:hypothetical protein
VAALNQARRRCKTAGRWIVRCAGFKGGNWIEVVGIADDYEEDNRTGTF